MTTLLKKDALYYLIPMLLMYPLLLLYWGTSREHLDSSMLLVQCFWIFGITFSGLSLQEQHESKFNGYAFLDTLPITNKEIVTSKFLVVFLCVSFQLVSNLVYFSLFPIQSIPASLARMTTLLSAVLTLFLCALTYIIIYRFGYSLFSKLVWAFYLILFALVILLDNFVFAPRQTGFLFAWKKTIVRYDAIGFIGFVMGTILFFTLLKTAVRIKNRREFV